MASISFGPKLGLLNNAAKGQTYYDQLRTLLQALDQLIMGSVLNSTTVVPPVSPNNGDAYLLLSTPSGAWTGQLGNIAVWDTQVTLTGTNTLNPSWVFYTPQPGWTLWNVSAASFLVFNGSSWSAVGGGANFPTNTDITSMTGIPNTTINTTGYVYNDGTNPPTYLGDAGTTGGTGPNGIVYGSGSFASPSSAGSVIVGNGPWAGSGVTGIAVGVVDSGGFSIMSPGLMGTSGGIASNGLTVTGTAHIVNLRVGTGGLTGDSSGQTLSLSGLNPTVSGVPGVEIGSGVSSPTSGIGLLGFGGSYFTQTTVGAAGGASALPATPRGYLQFVAPDGTICVFPYYAHA